ncbi:DUF2786 domain-containing protein [Nakamurella antarctica]|nr:DUF2786 domain-containing protein [Nakamurella antarctica]
MAGGKKGKSAKFTAAPLDDFQLPAGFPEHLKRPAADVVADLIRAAAAAAYGSQRRPKAVDVAVDSLTVLGQLEVATELHADHVISAVLAGVITELYERGWQPLDLPHVVRRAQDEESAELATLAVIEQSIFGRPLGAAPHTWLDQLAALGAEVPDAQATGDPKTDGSTAGGEVPAPTSQRRGQLGDSTATLVTDWALSHGMRPADGWRAALRVIGQLQELPGITRLVPPPSKWGMTPARTHLSSPQDLKMLTRIRALLAKAESTTFPAEAETFSAKAQDLMTRHEIDAAMVDRSGEVGGEQTDPTIHSVRVHIDDPYAREKAQLLATLGGVNVVRVIWDDVNGMAVMVGRELELELVEILFTSLLIQATRAMVASGEHSGDLRSPSFRRAFLLSYAARIGERLSEVEKVALEQAKQQYGTDLVPVLANRAEAVDVEFVRLFPNTRTGGGRQVNADGWWAGRAAADSAVIT